VATSAQSWTNKGPGHSGVSGSFDIMALLRRTIYRPHIVAAGMVVGVALGAGLIHQIKPHYTSSAVLLLQPKAPGTFGAASDFASLYVDGARVESVLQVMKSTDMLSHVVQSQGLADDPEFSAQSSSKLHDIMEQIHLQPRTPAPPETEEARNLRAMAQFGRSLKISRVGLTYAIEISVTASSAAKAQKLAEAVAENYLKEQTRSKTVAVDRDYDWLMSRLADQRKILRTSEQNVEDIRRKYSITEADTGPLATADEQSLQQMNAQLLQAETDVAIQRADYEQALHVLNSGGDIGAYLQGTKSPVLDELFKQRDASMRELANLSAVDTSANPKVVDAMRDKAALDAVVRAQGARLVAQLRQQLTLAEAKQQAITNSLAHITADNGSRAAGYVELRDARRAVEVNQGLYQVFLNKLQEVEQQVTRQDPEARIISPADAPDAPSFPKPILFLAGGAFLGMLAGAGITLMRPLPEKGFTNTTDLETRLSISLLGVLPQLKSSKRGKTISPSYIPNYLVVRPLSQYSECLRALRARLRIGMADGPHVLQVTSATVGEGKTTVAASLALSAALAGIRTVLVDIDIRNPAISHLFSLQAADGLMEILQDNRSPREIQRPHQSLPLTIIPAGHGVFARPDIISSRQLVRLIEDIGRDNELVILDTPPILAVSDPLFAGNVADTTLLVIESGGTPRPVVEQAVRTLQEAGVSLAGAVLNKVDPARTGRQLYGYGAYGSYQTASRRFGLPGIKGRTADVLEADRLIDGNA
jgi:succinoglycan biosynthesis transport protein ExoP